MQCIIAKDLEMIFISLFHEFTNNRQGLGCIWYSSQPITTFHSNYMKGMS